MTREADTAEPVENGWVDPERMRSVYGYSMDALPSAVISADQEWKLVADVRTGTPGAKRRLQESYRAIVGILALRFAFEELDRLEALHEGEVALQRVIEERDSLTPALLGQAIQEAVMMAVMKAAPDRRDDS